VLEGVAKLEPIEGAAVSVSAGVARYPADGTSAEILIAAARDAVAGADGRASIAEASAAG
jgi:hypothetical protein